MSAHEPVEGLRSGGDEPAFGAPWQAQAFAMTMALHENGLFTWPEWTEALGAEIATGRHGDGQEGYYLAWLAALEKIVSVKGIAKEAEIARRRAEWEKAARNTPHGMPIELQSEN